MKAGHPSARAQAHSLGHMHEAVGERTLARQHQDGVPTHPFMWVLGRIHEGVGERSCWRWHVRVCTKQLWGGEYMWGGRSVSGVDDICSKYFNEEHFCFCGDKVHGACLLLPKRIGA